MAEPDKNSLHWKAYLLGPVTGLPKLIGSLRRDDSTGAFHGAQATALGLIFFAGLFLLGFLLRLLLPTIGLSMDLQGLAATTAVWLCYYLWVGGGLWLYASCLVIVRSGGWRVAVALTKSALFVENAAAFLLRK
jgi:hypothetical protein